MDVCEAHVNASQIAAKYEGEVASELMEKLRERFENQEKNSVQNEISKFNSMCIEENQSGAEFVDELETQAKVCGDLGRNVAEDDKLTRLKEGLKNTR